MPLAESLLSTCSSARAHRGKTSFAGFFDAMDWSDFPRLYIAAVWPLAFPARCGGIKPSVESGDLSVQRTSGTQNAARWSHIFALAAKFLGCLARSDFL